MRRARITYEGAFHHVMNRGIKGEDIFTGNKNKNQFLNYLEEKSKKMKIPIFAYCIMNNHYHIVLQNTNCKMSEFMRQLDGEYGKCYRKHNGGKGYVFQDRYKSTLIQEDSYLRISIAYLLLNPVRAGIVKQIDEYIWSSIRDYYYREKSEIVDITFVEELFGCKNELFQFVYSQYGKEIPEIKTRYGNILGSPDFLKEALKKYDRRKGNVGIYGKRIDDKYFEPVEKVIWEFERMKSISIDDIPVDTYEGKRLRGELLVHLKDRAGLQYSEIIKFDIFDDLKYTSLSPIYRNTKKRLKGMRKEKPMQKAP